MTHFKTFRSSRNDYDYVFYRFGRQLPTSVKIITSFCVRSCSFLAASQDSIIGSVPSLRAGRCGFRISAKIRGFSVLQKRPDHL
jgi:hypothetical protein